jgi:copper(I)-binding protein
VITAWRRLALGATGAGLAAAISLVAPPGAGATSSASGTAANKSMQVTGAFLPLPASPSVASAYFELHNLTGRADALVAISTSVAKTTMAMSEGTSSMEMLGAVTVPAHGTVSFTPGHDHLMLQGLNRKLQVGQVVDVRLQFRQAGTLEVEIPVVPLDRILPSANGSAATAGSGTKTGSGTTGTGGKSKGGGSTTKSPPTTMGKMPGMAGM